MLLDWKNQYCQNDYPTLGNLQIQCTPYQVNQDTLNRTRTEYFKILWKHTIPWIAEVMLEKKNGNEGIKLPDFRSYYKVIRSVWYWHKNRNIDQWNRIENPEINSSTYGQVIYYKGGKNIQCKKDSLFNKCCCDLCQSVLPMFSSRSSIVSGFIYLSHLSILCVFFHMVLDSIIISFFYM